MSDDVEILLLLAAEAVGRHMTPLPEVFAQCCPGARVWATADADMALRYLMARGEFAGRDDRSQPELVILQAAPATDGALALLAAIKDYPGTCAVPVVVVTPHPGNETLRQYYAAGVNSVVADTGDLGSMVKAIGTLHAFWTRVNETLYFHPEPGSSHGPALPGCER